MIKKAIPILPVGNLKATIDFFENNLGFKAVNTGNCIILKNGFSEIQLEYVTDKNKKTATTGSCCLYVINIQDLYTVLSSRDLISPAGAMQQSIFGIKQFFIKDNNGNTIYLREQTQTN